MIKVSGVEKSYGKFKALNQLDLTVKKGSIYGLVGTNGAGKTTVIKHLTGILMPDKGVIEMDGEPVYENVSVKRRLGYIPDDLYFFGSYNLKEMARFYKSLYASWNQERFDHMCRQFSLSTAHKLSRFSKGMLKQAAFLLTMSSMPDFLILDEPIDGLDPIIRKLVWKYIVDDVAERQMTVLVSSHNLRELEGICDSIGIISGGAMLLERDLDELKTDIHKVQVAFRNRPENPYQGLTVLHRESRGTVDLLIVRNRKDIVEEVIARQHPAVFDLLPLSLEEIFIYELGGGENNEFQSILF